MKIIVINILFICLTILNSQSVVKIIEPKKNAKIQQDEFLTISWISNDIAGKVQLSYSLNNRNWLEIDRVNAVERSYSWFISDIDDSDGKIFLKVQSVQYPSIYSVVNLQLPNYTGTVAAADRIDQYVIITKKIDNIRSGPATSYSIIGKCRKDELYDYLGEEGNWYIIRYNNEVAYTHKTNGTMFSYSDADYIIDEAKAIFFYCLLPILIIGALIN